MGLEGYGNRRIRTMILYIAFQGSQDLPFVDRLTGLYVEFLYLGFLYFDDRLGLVDLPQRIFYLKRSIGAVTVVFRNMPDRFRSSGRLSTFGSVSCRLKFTRKTFYFQKETNLRGPQIFFFSSLIWQSLINANSIHSRFSIRTLYCISHCSTIFKASYRKSTWQSAACFCITCFYYRTDLQ